MQGNHKRLLWLMYHYHRRREQRAVTAQRLVVADFHATIARSYYRQIRGMRICKGIR
jgi:hypothetical protein